MDFPERAECDFTLHPMAHMKKPIRCNHCDEYSVDPIWVTKEIGRGTMQYAFCCQDHAEKFYLNRIKG